MNKKDNECITCNKCNKEFKTINSKKRHILHQICVPLTYRTYCKLCNKSYENRKKYEEHLISIEHLQNYNRIETKNIDNELKKNKILKKKDVFLADPLLSADEKKELYIEKPITSVIIKKQNDPNNLYQVNVKKARSFIDKEIEYKKQRERYEEEIKKIIQKEEELKKKQEEYNKNYINGHHYIEQPNNILDYNEIIRAELYAIPPKTERQERILNYLIKCQKMDNNYKKEKFLEILKLLSLEDANYLTSHIRTNKKLNDNTKQLYMDIIEKFCTKLMTLLENGIKVIDNIPIENYVIKISK